jgi:hypothetical protein
MEIFFILLLLVGICLGIYMFTRTSDGLLDMDGDGDVDLDDVEVAVRELASMTKSELLEYAESQGIDIPKSWTKAKILARLDV